MRKAIAVIGQPLLFYLSFINYRISLREIDIIMIWIASVV